MLPASYGFGDVIAAVLVRLGIHKRLGCGCSARQERLNRFGSRLVKVWKGIAKMARFKR